MQYSSNGILLSRFKYNDTSVIVNIYTREHGIKACMLRVGKTRKSRGVLNILQPLFLLDFIIDIKEKREIQYVKDVKPYYSLKSIPFDIYKNTIAAFLAEILNKSLREEEENPELYEFIESSIISFDNSERSYTSFHPYFLIHLSKHLGFYPGTGKSQYFNMAEGVYTDIKPIENYCLKGEELHIFSEIAAREFTNYENTRISTILRNKLIDKILDFYRLQLDDFGNVKSFKVLKEVYSG